MLLVGAAACQYLLACLQVARAAQARAAAQREAQRQKDAADQGAPPCTLQCPLSESDDAFFQQRFWTGCQQCYLSARSTLSAANDSAACLWPTLQGAAKRSGSVSKWCSAKEGRSSGLLDGRRQTGNQQCCQRSGHCFIAEAVLQAKQTARQVAKEAAEAAARAAADSCAVCGGEYIGQEEVRTLSFLHCLTSL